MHTYWQSPRECSGSETYATTCHLHSGGASRRHFVLYNRCYVQNPFRRLLSYVSVEPCAQQWQCIHRSHQRIRHYEYIYPLLHIMYPFRRFWLRIYPLSSARTNGIAGLISSSGTTIYTNIFIHTYVYAWYSLYLFRRCYLLFAYLSVERCRQQWHYGIAGVSIGEILDGTTINTPYSGL